jgi:hypothetical protein
VSRGEDNFRFLAGLVMDAAHAIGKVLRKRRRAIPHVKISEVEPGAVVVISGRGFAETRVQGEVLCTRTKLERDDGGIDVDWHLLREELQHVPVFVEDDSGELASIDMSRATIVIGRSDSTLSRPEVPSTHVLEWAATHGERVSSAQMLRLTVESLIDGDTLFILGTGERFAEAAGDPYRSSSTPTVRVHIVAKVVSQEPIEDLIATRRLED